MNGFRCMWSMVGHPVCAKPATHGTLIGEGVYYLCNYHAGRARRDGWRGVRKLKAVPA
jgi:hypothetical protein